MDAFCMALCPVRLPCWAPVLLRDANKPLSLRAPPAPGPATWRHPGVQGSISQHGVCTVYRPSRWCQSLGSGSGSGRCWDRNQGVVTVRLRAGACRSGACGGY
ncbi:unnamed protein product [Gadus morhua 'NCC']